MTAKSLASAWRLHLMVAALAVGFLALLGRLCYIQASSAKEIREDFHIHQEAHCTMAAPRGAITDAFDHPLACSLPVRTVSVFMREFNPADAHEAAEKLAPLLKGPAADLEAKFSSGRSGQIVLAHDVDYDDAQMAELLHIPGIKFDEAFERVYPGGPMLCHILGRISPDETAAEGLELTWNDCLKGTPGEEYWDTTGRRQMLGADPVANRPAVPGDTLTLTIDIGIQTILEEELHDMVLKFNPKGASAIVMDPNTGDVLAAANFPDFDPNHFADSIPDARRNRLITDVYEPGSTFKSFIISLAIDQNAVTPATRFDCEDGVWIVGHRRLHDAEKLGVLSVADILADSSNIGAAKTALHWCGVNEYDLLHHLEPASRDRILAMAKRMDAGLNSFGFGEKTGIDLAGEVPGILHPPEKWTRDSCLSVPFGQEVGVTALQLADAYCAVVNGGHLLTPHVILRRTHGDGSLAYERQVEVRGNPIREATSETMRQLLRGVVEHGTAKAVEFPGLLMGGKTGTAQKVMPDGTYSHTDYVGSFAGFAPYDRPELVAIVIIDSPDRSKGYYGGTVAAPAVQSILRRALGMRGELTPAMVAKAKLEAKAATAAATATADGRASASTGSGPIVSVRGDVTAAPAAPAHATHTKKPRAH